MLLVVTVLLFGLVVVLVMTVVELVVPIVVPLVVEACKNLLDYYSSSYALMQESVRIRVTTTKNKS